MRIGLSMLCERPDKRTGLTSLFQNFIKQSLEAYPDLELVLFVESHKDINIDSTHITVADGYPSNDKLIRRVATEHFILGSQAKRLGCNILLTTGLRPIVLGLPSAMHLLTLHHLGAENRTGGLRSYYRDWATRHGLRKADLIITNTRFAASQILSVAPTAATKLLQSYEGIDHSVFHAISSAGEVDLLRLRFGIKPGYFFWCSNFYPYKQAELLMEAWCDLPTSVREAAPMVMVGGAGWGDSREAMLAIAERRGAMSQVKLLGWVSDDEIPILHRHASVFVHSSREETFGRSVLEAMASGVPTVVHEIPVMLEVTGGHCLMVDYANREQAASAMLEAHENKLTRERLIRGGLERAKMFSFRRLAIERIEAIRSILGLKAGCHAAEYPPVFANQF